MNGRFLSATILILCLALPLSADSINWHCVNSGGGICQSADYTIQGSIGQPVAGVVASAPYSADPTIHYIGFWSGDLREPTLEPSIHNVKDLPDGSYVSLSGLYVTTNAPTDFADKIYLEAEDRSSGIQFYHGSASIPALAEGSQVSVIGSVKVLSNGESALVGSYVIPLVAGSPATAIRPLGFQTAQIGCENPGMPGAIGVTNTGLLVRVWGAVAGREMGTNYVLIDDGSGLLSGSLRVDPSKLTSIPGSGYIQITGISSVEYRGTDLVPVVRPRRQSDLVPLAAP